MVRYGRGMIETAVDTQNAGSIEATMQRELALGDAAVEGVVPILRHLLASDSNALFSEEIVARVRGMAHAFAAQLIERIWLVARETHNGADDAEAEQGQAIVSALTDAFANDTVFLHHVHALALEWQLTERLQSRLGVDPVVSPLLQSQIASAQPATSALAMKLLASQARFCQAQRRMHQPLVEVPDEVLARLVKLTAEVLEKAGYTGGDLAQRASEVLAARDSAETRLGQISALLTGMGGEAVSALSITHAGPAIFLSALAMGSGMGRDAAVLATNEAQRARFALALRAAGLNAAGIEAQFLALHPDITLPEGFERLGADRAAAILAVGDGSNGG